MKKIKIKIPRRFPVWVALGALAGSYILRDHWMLGAAIGAAIGVFIEYSFEMLFEVELR